MLKTKRFLKILFLIFAVILFLSNIVVAKTYYYTFNNKNGIISFKIATNFILLNANAQKFKGYILINSEDKKNIDKVEAQLVVDTNSIYTKISSVDDRMQNETLDSKQYPKIIFNVNNVKITKNYFETFNLLYVTLYGKLTIRNITRKIEIPVKIKVSPDRSNASVSGKYNINFNDFKVPDPSILFAKVDPNLELEFNLVIR